MKIEICKHCDGNGEITKDVGLRSTEWETTTCPKCNGTGRVINGSFSYSIPYGKTTIDEIYKMESELIKQLQSKIKHYENIF